MSDENTVMAQAVKTFDGDEGFKTPASAPFAVERRRFADLAANGLVVEANGAAGEAAEASVPTGASTEAGGPTEDQAEQAGAKAGRGRAKQ